ncbi:sensory rhodopsin transducer [Tengunoibacter tsumagoiensis]|uniref:Uncharacterized protein n=1 Tax=Tengunoibacter tsumagoiensis TaxID=2014871 RepID=A0A402A995_9CHLR|nr:sensory rhodopsin transducer [Tengunoibacter tsumagoiensis]GCE15747.1 hypothetical protein KTT_56060 [Tengunoibacter tsumagoiensis]
MHNLTEWYYPGGYIYAVGNLPADQDDAWFTSSEGWELFFLSNPTAEDQEVQLRFYFSEKEPVDTTYHVPARSSSMFPIFERKYSHLTGGYNSPFGIRIQSNQPLLPHITRAEFEPWTDTLPGAMFGVTPYQGPLTHETCWSIADGLVSDTETHPLKFQEWIQVLNPGLEATTLLGTIYLPDRKIQFQKDLPAERVLLCKLEEMDELPKGVPFALKIEAQVPIVVQQIRRGLEQGAHPATRSILSTLGVVLNT